VTSETRLTAKPIKIKLFASAREVLNGENEIVLQFKQGAIESTELRERILQVYPQLRRIPFVLAINYKIVRDKPSPPTDVRSKMSSSMSPIIITGEDEIALLPPISGG
jgi:molybdopterin converting factor small subunit